MSTSRFLRRSAGSGKRLGAVALALALGATACTSADDGDPSTTPTTDLSSDGIVLTSALEAGHDCDVLLERITAEAAERVGPFGFDNGQFRFFEDDVFVEEEEAMEDEAAFDSAESFDAGSAEVATAAEGDGGGAGTDFSGTNNQEQGVDEADLVKTDGERLVVLSGNQLRVVDTTGDVPVLANTIQLDEEFYGGELFLNGDTALLMTSGYTEFPLSDAIADSEFAGSSVGRLVEIDLVDGEVGRTLEFEGGYLSAREIDGSIRIVMSATENRFSFVFPSNQGAEDAAAAANRALVEDSTIDMWIPSFRITEGGQTVESGPVVDCDRVHLPNEFAGFGSLVVMTANIEDGLEIDDALSVFTDGQTVYASTDRLAVATPRWPEFDNNGEVVDGDGYRTAIHTFDIGDPVRTDYAASGSVRGTLLNRFSMSEHEGNLRIATTDGSPWDSRGSESFVTVLDEQSGDLVEVGQVGGLGPGETIFAVRFLGEKGYVVTFEQIDPLYTVDLSDPGNPTVEGELKITGVSDYLHPFGPDLLIGVGRDGDEEGLTGSVAVSVFDVSDPTNPTRIDNLSLGVERPENPEEFNGWAESFSPVQWDARAFTLWGDTMVVPVGWWSFVEEPGNFQEENGNFAALVQIDGDTGTLTKVGEVGHPRTTECEGRGGLLPVEPNEAPAIEVFTGDASSTDGLAIVGANATTPVPAEEATEPAPAQDATSDAEASFVREDDEISEPAPEGEQFCYSFQPEIRRSVVIGEDLYTISDSGVAVNTFEGLDTITWIPFER